MTKIRESYSKDNEIRYLEQRIDTLNQANKFYNYKFNKDIEFANKRSEAKILLLNNKFRKLFSKEFRSYFSEKGYGNAVKLILLTKTPFFARTLSSIKRKVILSVKRFRSNSI